MYTLLLLFSTLSLAAGWVCGNDHPHYAQEMSTLPVVVPQAYHEDDRRVLAGCTSTTCAQSYGTSTTWVPLTAASSSPIRITVLWDLIGAGDSGVCDDGTAGPCIYQCTLATSTGVKVKQSDGSTYSSSGFSCSAGDAVGAVIPSTATPTSPMSLNMQIMQSRTSDAVAKWAATLRVVPVKDAISIATTGLGNSALAVTTHLPPSVLTQTATDLVVIMTARPSPNSPISGYALCLQQDQWGRCTVGQFNWVPGVLDQAGYAAGSDPSRESELHTAIHELAHIFGAMGPGVTQATSNFVSPLDGTRQPTASVLTILANDPAFPTGSLKPVTYISTPKVLNLTRTYYACGTAHGFPLEDVPLGKGAHWEARVAGPELMSYGSNSGQVYISDLTLAYLEDTNHFLANYSSAGWLFPPTYNDFGQAGSAGAFLGADGSPYTPPAPPPPGTPRWGYKAGCAWLGQEASNPPLSASILPPYSCSTQGAYTCTSDNRMSAVCSVLSTYTTVSDKPSWGQYNQVGAGGGSSSTVYGPQGFSTPGASPGYVNTLPLWARWFSDAGAAAANPTVAGASAANTGGYNDAMDYMPVPVGYWSCVYQIPGSNSSASGESNAGATVRAIAAAFGNAGDMAKFGGQARCPTCRCFPSSLMEMSSLNLNTKFPAYGLCYRTNCASPDYLQVAIKGQLDGATYWYLCPAAGGKLYIPGYFGALTCPVTAPFCALEPISGLRYPEQSVYWEWIFWAVCCGSALLTLLVCGCPCARNCCINHCKRVCGARVFDPPGGHNDVSEPLPPTPARALLITSIITLCAGGAMAGVMAWIIKTTLVFQGTVSILGIGVLLLMTSVLGLCGARKKAEFGPSCWILTYFFFDLTLIVLAMFVTIWQFQFSSWGTLVSANYYGIVAAGFYSPTNTTQAANVAACTAQVQNNVTSLMGLCIAMLVALTVGLVAAGQLIRLRVLVSIVLSFVNNLLLAFGALIVAVSIYLYVKNGTLLAGMTDVMGYVLGLAIIFLAVAITGHCTVRHKSGQLLVAYLVLGVALVGVSGGGVWLCFNNTAYIQGWITSVSDSTLSSVATSLGFSGNKASFVTSLQSNLQQIGLAFGVVMVLQVLGIVCAAFFGCAARAWRIQHGLAEDGKQRRKGKSKRHHGEVAPGRSPPDPTLTMRNAEV